MNRETLSRLVLHCTAVLNERPSICCCSSCSPFVDLCFVLVAHEWPCMDRPAQAFVPLCLAVPCRPLPCAASAEARFRGTPFACKEGPCITVHCALATTQFCCRQCTQYTVHRRTVHSAPVHKLACHQHTVCAPTSACALQPPHNLACHQAMHHPHTPWAPPTTPHQRTGSS